MEPSPELRKIDKIKTEFFIGLADAKEFVPSEVFYAKHNKKEKVEVEEGCMDLKLSKFELVLGICMRLCGRWQKQEIEILENDTNVPVLIGDSEGYKGRYRSISQMQTLLKTWRKNREDGISNDEIDKLCHITQALKTDPGSVNSTELGFEQVNVNMSETHCSELPVVSGCIKKADGSFGGVTCTIDSGASSSACGEGLLTELGFTKKDLIPCPHIRVNTANSPCMPLGILKTKIYLKWRNKKFYYINCEILVLSTNLNKLLIGIKDLYRADFSLDKDKITLDCSTLEGNQKRRVFQTSTKGNWNTNIELTPLMSTGEKETFKFKSDHHLGMVSTNWNLVVKKNEKKKNRINEVKLPIGEEIKIKNLGSNITINDSKLEDVNFVGEIEISYNLKKTWENCSFFLTEAKGDEGREDELMAEEMARAVEDFQLYYAEKSEEEKNYRTFEEAEKEIEAIGPESESHLLSKMSLFPDEAPEDDPEYFIPDLSGMDEEWQTKFRSLFSKYKHNFSENKWDVVISKLPEVDLPTKPNKVACDPNRRYNEDELCILDQYLEELEKKGLIRRLNPDEFSPWNHNMHLVFRQTGGAKRFCSSMADRVSNEERLKLLRESSRAVSDVVSFNRLLLGHGPVYLPMVSEVLPYLGGKLASLTDVRSGFSTIGLNYESQLKTAFTHRNIRFIHKNLLQGASISPLIYSHRMELVFNKETFKIFLNKNAPNSKLQYNYCFFRYLDDLLLVSDTLEEMLLLWKYTMEQLDIWNIKITKKKTSICSPRFTFLGWDFRPIKNLYSMESQRRSAISQWEFKPDRSNIVSRLACLNWNSNLIFGFKYLSQLLSSLVQQKHMKVRHSHVREWLLLIFASSWVMNIHIPDLSRSFLLASDSSFSACGSLLFQYFPEKPYATPEGIVWDKEDQGKDILKNQEGEEVMMNRLEVVGMFTKRWGKDVIGRSIVYKECLALMCTLKEYDLLIRSCSAQVLMWTDCSCLAFLHRLKSVNSRIYNIALILSSYPQLSIYFSKGGYLTFTSDLLSRVLENNDIKFDGAIDPKYLEILPEQVLDKIVIDAETIHKICTAPLSPEFSALAVRRQQAYERVLTEDRMIDLLNSNRYPENCVLDAVCYGRDYIKPDSVIFMNKKDKNIISQTEYNKLAQKMNFSAIKAELMFLAEHSFHTNNFVEIGQLCRGFLENLKNFMEGREDFRNISLMNDVNKMLRQPRWGEEEFYDFLEKFQKSVVYNTDVEFDDLTPCLFIPTFIEQTTEIIMEYNEGQLNIRAMYDREVKMGEPVVFSVNIQFLSKYFFSIESCIQGLFYPVCDENGISKSFTYLVLGCNPGHDYSINRNQLLCRIQFHFGQKECSCVTPAQIHFVVEKQTQVSGERNVQILMTELMFRDTLNLRQCVYCRSDVCLCEDTDVLMTETEPGPRPIGHLDCGQPNIGDLERRQTPTISHLNQLITLCLSFNKKNVFSPKHVQNLQSSSEFLVKVRELIKQKKTDKYFLYKNCIFFKDKLGNRKLCIDDSTCLLLFTSLHSRNIHHSQSILLEHFRNYFHNINDKKYAEQSINECGVCQFGRNCKKVSFIKNYRDEECPKIFQTVHGDICENMYKSDNGFSHFIVLTDRASNKVFGAPLKTLQSEEICEFFNNIIRYVGVFANLYTDFGSAFTSTKFQNLLNYYKINHFRSCSRSVSNGLSEQSVKWTRSKIKDLILNDSAQRRQKWDIFFNDVLLLINSCAPLNKINNYSRDRLFYGGNRFLYNVAWNNECHMELNETEHQRMLLNLHNFRLQYRQHFKDKINPFCLGQLCVYVKSKEDMKDDGDQRGRHLQASVGEIMRVIGLNRVACKVVNLNNGSEQSIDWGRLRSLSLTEIKNIFSNPKFGRESTFRDNMYKPGYNQTCLEFIQDLINKTNPEIDSTVDPKFRIRGDEGSSDFSAANEEPSTGGGQGFSANENSDTTQSDAGLTNEDREKTLDPGISTNESPGLTSSDPESSDLDNSHNRLKRLANHPYPSDLLDEFILRDPLRNPRYPARVRRPPARLRDPNIMTAKVRFCPDIKCRSFNTDEEGEYIFNHQTNRFQSEDSIETDHYPLRPTVVARRGIKLQKDLSHAELQLLKPLEGLIPID